MNIAKDVLPVLKSISQFGIDHLCSNIHIILVRNVLLYIFI